VRAKLREIDDDVSAAVLSAVLQRMQIRDFRAEAARAIERAPGPRRTTRPSRTPRTRFTLQRAREKLGLPRV
jgi:hypothetical protein